MSRPRIVSLCPSNTEILCAMDLGAYLVGVDNYSDYPASMVHHLPRLGPDLHIDIDMVVSLKPDLVVASLSVPGMERVVASLQSAGLHHIVLSPHRIADVFEDMMNVAKELSQWVDHANLHRTLTSLQNRVERVASTARHTSYHPELFWEWWPKPIFSPASNNWLTELSQLAGAANIFANVPGDQVQDDGSRVISADPDYMLAVWTGVDQEKVPLRKILNRSGWTSTKAFRHDQIYILSEGLYCRPSPRLIDGLEQLFALVHPDLALQLSLPPAYHFGPIRNASGQWLGGKQPGYKD